MAQIDELREATQILLDLSKKRFKDYSSDDMTRVRPERMIELTLLNQQGLLMGLLDELAEFRFVLTRFLDRY